MAAPNLSPTERLVRAMRRFVASIPAEARHREPFAIWLRPAGFRGPVTAGKANAALATIFDFPELHAIGWNHADRGEHVTQAQLVRLQQALQEFAEGDRGVFSVAAAHSRMRPSGQSLEVQWNKFMRALNDAQVDLIDASIRPNGDHLTDDELLAHGRRALQVRTVSTRQIPLRHAAAAAQVRGKERIGLSAAALEWWLGAQVVHKESWVSMQAAECFRDALELDVHSEGTDIGRLRSLGERLARDISDAMKEAGSWQVDMPKLQLEHAKTLATVSPAVAAEQGSGGMTFADHERDQLLLAVVIGLSATTQSGRGDMPVAIQRLAEIIAQDDEAFTEDARRLWATACDSRQRIEVDRTPTPAMNRVLSQLRFDLRNRADAVELNTLITQVAAVSGLSLDEMHRVDFLSFARLGDFESCRRMIRSARGASEDSQWIHEPAVKKAAEEIVEKAWLQAYHERNEGGRERIIGIARAFAPIAPNALDGVVYSGIVDRDRELLAIALEESRNAWDSHIALRGLSAAYALTGTNGVATYLQEMHPDRRANVATMSRYYSVDSGLEDFIWEWLPEDFREHFVTTLKSELSGNGPDQADSFSQF